MTQPSRVKDSSSNQRAPASVGPVGEEFSPHTILLSSDQAGTHSGCGCDKDEDDSDSIVTRRASAKNPSSERGGTSAYKGHCSKCGRRRAKSLRQRLGTGRSLPPQVRRVLETAFRKSLSDIRVHSDPRAAEICAEQSAAAVTFGNRIVFGDKRYKPNSLLGRALIAHEVAHVLERGSGTTSSFGAKDAMTATPATSEVSRVERKSTLTRLLEVWKKVKTGTASVSENPRQLLAAASRLTMTACGKSDPCDVTGSFSKVPSGNLTATVRDSALGKEFWIVSVFQPAEEGCNNCACGEYRQYVKGSYERNGFTVTHPLCGTDLSSSYQEDCSRSGSRDSKYGYRNLRVDTSYFWPSQATGCRFRGYDYPRITGASGDTVGIDLGFKGELVDACDGDRQLAVSEWTVKGTGTVP